MNMEPPDKFSSRLSMISFDNYINMDIAMERIEDGPEFVRVIKQMNEKDGRSIGIASDNPILDTCIYEVEYVDRYK